MSVFERPNVRDTWDTFTRQVSAVLKQFHRQTLCSHGTVQYFRSVYKELSMARRLNFLTVKVAPYE